MLFQKIEQFVEIIRSNLKSSKIKEALDYLELFIKEIQNEDLDRSLIALYARYNEVVKQDIRGTKTDNVEFHKILDGISKLLNETKENAIDQAKIQSGVELEKLNHRGQEVLNTLEKITILMAESRLLEIEMTHQKFGLFFSETQNYTMNQHIESFKAILSKTKAN